MNIAALVGVGLVAAVLSIVIKQYKPELGIFISLFAGIIILSAILGVLKPAIDTILELVGMAGLDESYGNVLIKALAVCYVTQIAADSCRDAGEGAIAGKVEMAGKAAIIVISLPMFKALVNTVSGLFAL